MRPKRGRAIQPVEGRRPVSQRRPTGSQACGRVGGAVGPGGMEAHVAAPTPMGTLSPRAPAPTPREAMPNITVLETTFREFGHYYLPTIVVLGSLGNTVSVLVFFCTKLRKQSSSHYLAVLAFSDTGFLICTIQFWPIEIEWSALWCVVVHYMTHVCAFLSSWLVVAFTGERWVAVRWPLHRKRLCTVGRAKSILLALVVVALALNTPHALTPMVVQNGTCTFDESHQEAASVKNSVDTVLTLVLPFAAIATLNVHMCRMVRRVARQRRSMTLEAGGVARGVAVPGAAPSPPARPLSAHRDRANRVEANVTRMLKIVSAAFLLLNLPSYLVRLLTFVWNTEHPPYLGLLRDLSFILYYINYGINFVLYCFSGQNFRRSLVNMFCCRKRRRPNSTQIHSGVRLYESRLFTWPDHQARPHPRSSLDEHARMTVSRQTSLVSGPWAPPRNTC